MGRNPNTLEQYQELAEENGLQYLEADSAPTTKTTARWKCLNCDRIIYTSYNHVKYDKSPCICRTGIVLKLDDYQQLANRLNIVWSGRKTPKSTKARTLWYSNRKQEYFSASYAELAYGKIKSTLQALISDN